MLDVADIYFIEFFSFSHCQLNKNGIYHLLRDKCLLFVFVCVVQVFTHTNVPLSTVKPEITYLFFLVSVKCFCKATLSCRKVLYK